MNEDLNDLIVTPEMLPYCRRTMQTTIAQAMLDHDNNIFKVAKLLDKHTSNIRRSVKLLVHYSASKGIYSNPALPNTPISPFEGIKGSSTLYKFENKEGVILKWVKTDVDKQKQLDNFEHAIKEIMETLPQILPIAVPPIDTEDLLVYYNVNDLHLGLLADGEETRDIDWTLEGAVQTINQAAFHLVSTSPHSKYAVVTDLGDLVETDNYSNQTARSGNILDVSARYTRILPAAINALLDLCYKALEHHETVYFYNIPGNHDDATALAIRFAVYHHFFHEKRLIVDIGPQFVKYHHFGVNLLGFAHGHGLKMARAGEVMAVDCLQILAQTSCRDFHFGHNHKDSVIDGPICRAISHRNLPGLNAWASNQGYRRQIGTMKAHLYHREFGDMGTNVFNVLMAPAT